AVNQADLAAPEKQVWTMNLGGEPNFLDPQRASFSNDLTVVKQLYRGLLYIDKNDPNKVIAAAAKDVPSAANGGIAADGKTYTLHLKSGLKWADGSALTAKDFEYGIKRLFDPNLAGDYSSFYFNIAGSEDYYNALGTKKAPKTPTPDQLSALRDKVMVKATDDATLVINLLQPQPSFNTLLTLWPVDPVQKAQIDKLGDKAFAEAANIVGDGPFKMTSWDHKNQLVLEKNPNWWGDDKPTLTKITMKMIEDDTVAFTAYKNGELDAAGVPLADVDVVQSDPQLKKENVRFNEQTTFGLEYNNTKAPFDDVNVRKAFSEAIDRDAFIKGVRKGIGTAAYSWLPPGVPDYDASLGQQFKLDSTKAKADLAKSKYGANLPGMKITFAQGASNQLQSEFLQNQLQTNLGIKVDLEALESATYKSRYQQNDFQMVFGGWGSDYADPEDWIPDLFGTGGGNNKYQYSNPKVDALIKQAKSETDNAKRLDDYKQAQALIVDDQPMSFIFYRQRNSLFKSYLKGVIQTGLDGISGDWFYTNVAITKH
ncbi:MAG: peptide ABC transporter substrate-binding protein, partial [Dehalococcoidia bacterium]